MAVAVANPISVPTGLGAREVLDVGGPVLNLQKIEAPQASLHQCASRYGAQTVRAIFEKLALKDEVAAFTELNLSDNSIGDEGAEWLLRGLTGKTKSGEQVGKNLKLLRLPRARVGAAGMKAIGGILASSSSLENVVLSSNTCEAAGVEGAFCDGLAKNTSLKSLVLAVNRLGDKGAQLLCDGPFKVHPKLEHISLEYNRLEVAAAKSLADMLAVNQALRFLDLAGNRIGSDGALLLIEGIKKNKGRLERLIVSQNELRFLGVQAFARLFQQPEGKNLTYLDLRHNGVPYDGIGQIRKELGRPLGGDDAEGWMLLFGNRQLLLNR